MTDATVVQIIQKGLILAVTISAPVLISGLLMGVLVGIFQAATQIHEMSLTFVPKIIAVALTVVIFGQWMLTQMTTFTTGILNNIPQLVR